MGTAFGPLGGGFWVTLVSKTPKTKKDTKTDLEDSPSGVQFWTQNQNRYFFGKSGTRHEKMGSQTGSGKNVLSGRGQDLKNDDPYIIFNCFLSARTFKIKQTRCAVVQNRRYHRFLEKRRLFRNNRKSKPQRGPGAPTSIPNRRENGPGLHKQLEKLIF